jgi:hypothetical protein
MTVYVDFFMVGAVFFVLLLLLFPHCSTFLSPEMLTQLLSSFFCFYFFWIYTITVLGGPAQLTTKVLRSTSFFGGLIINDHEPNHLIHYESHSGIGKWQLQDQRRGFFLALAGLRRKKVPPTRYSAPGSQLDTESIWLDDSRGAGQRLYILGGRIAPWSS